MEVSCAAPLSVGSFVWQPRPEAYALAVVCKATYTLEQDVSRLADAADEPIFQDVYWKDSPAASLCVPSDLVPFKRRVDVLVGGHVHAPRGQRARSLAARLYVGTVNKTIAVFGDRMWMQDGRITGPAPFQKIPILWERAEGGARTWNPVGIPMGALASAQAPQPLPNFEPVGFVRQGPAHTSMPVGFGALAPLWPTRSMYLRGHRATFKPDRWYESPLPGDVDAAYFNAAPPDQQLDRLPEWSQLYLEHLHPEIPRLSTMIEDIRPRALVTRLRAAPEEVWLQCDTLFIDADRGVCTLTWRASVPLGHAHEKGIVHVSSTRASALAMPSDASSPPPPEDSAVSFDEIEDAETTDTAAEVGLLFSQEPLRLGYMSPGAASRPIEAPPPAPSSASLPMASLDDEVTPMPRAPRDEPAPPSPQLLGAGMDDEETSTQLPAGAPGGPAPLPFQSPTMPSAGAPMPPAGAPIPPAGALMPPAGAPIPIEDEETSTQLPDALPDVLLPFHSPAMGSARAPAPPPAPSSPGLPFQSPPAPPSRSAPSPAPPPAPSSPGLPFQSPPAPPPAQAAPLPFQSPPPPPPQPAAPPLAMPVLGRTPLSLGASPARSASHIDDEATQPGLMPDEAAPLPFAGPPQQQAASLPFAGQPLQSTPSLQHPTSALPFAGPLQQQAASLPFGQPLQATSSLPFSGPLQQQAASVPFGGQPQQQAASLPFGQPLQPPPSLQQPASALPFGGQPPPIDTSPMAAPLFALGSSQGNTSGTAVPIAPVPIDDSAVERDTPARAGPPGLSIEQYARIKIELWGTGAALHEILEEHGIDEIEWRVHERWQADALAAEAREGRCDLALALVAAFESAQAEAERAEQAANDPLLSLAEAATAP